MRIARLVLPLLFLARLVSAQTAEQCAPGKTPILILGSYHMASPGLDAVNMEVDDIRSPRRQKELAELIDRLARFKATKVAIESGHWTTTWTDRYRLWRENKYEMGRNEIEQIGFHVARRGNHERLWPVDYPMWMNGLTPAEQHKPKKKPEAPTAAAAEGPRMAEVRASVAADAKRLRESHVADYLAHLNTPSQYAQNHQWDVIANLTPGDGPALYANTDLATNWYKRNLRIFTNIMEITEPNDRILLIFGAGHLQILNDLAKVHPRYCVVDTLSYLK